MSFCEVPSLALALGLVAAGQRRAWAGRKAWWTVSVAAALLVVALAFVPGNYALRHVVAECLMPAGLAWIGLAALAVALWRHRQLRLALAATALWLLYSLAGSAFVGDWMLASLERRYVGIDPLAQARFDAVLVLGGGATAREDGTAALTVVAERVVLAVRMFRAGLTDTLVTSGPIRKRSNGRIASDPAATVAVWSSLGVPAERTVKLEGTLTTSDEIPAFRALVKERGWRRVGVISSAWHLPRAMRLAKRAGLDVTPLPADRHEAHDLGPRWFVPQEVGFREVQSACWELLGMLAGR